MNMKTFSKTGVCAVLLALLLLALAPQNALCGGAAESGGVAASGKVEMRWYQPEPEGHAWTDVSMIIAKEVGEKSGGGLSVTVYPAGVLGTQAEAVDMLRTGSLALLTSGPSILASFYDAVQVASLPYIFDNPEHAYNFLASPYGQRVYNDIILKKSGVRTLDFWYFGNRNLTTKGVKVNNPSDLAGIKIRAMDTPIAKTVVSSLGGSPVPINFSELYLALQTGVVAGQENPIPTIIAQKFYEVQDNIVLTGHSVHMGTVHVSESIWTKLADDQRKLILDTLAKYRPEIQKRINDQTDQGISFLKERGVAVYEPDLAVFRSNAADIVDKNFGNIPEWKEAIDAVRALKK
jgi:tripartite ATP-independent transporter DctP family solute receptor